MAKRGRKKYFSLIFVPDQEQEPVSLSMSYLKGKWLIALIAVLCIHVVLGLLAYYKIFQLERTRSELVSVNAELTTRNKRIELIAQEFEEIRVTDEKIRKAFGSSLGLAGNNHTDLLDDVPLTMRRTDYDNTALNVRSEESESTRRGLYFLTKSNSDYLNPDYIPNSLPVEGFLTTHFYKGGWYIGKSHFGIDIAAAKGSAIHAAGSGVVLVANWTPDFGNVVIISHGQGLFSYYAHAMHLLVRQGFKVKKGQPIALLGSSGISSAPHLHFEIWKNDMPLNPEDVIYALPQQEPAEGS